MLILASKFTTGYVSISALASLVGIPIVIPSSAATIKICVMNESII